MNNAEYLAYLRVEKKKKMEKRVVTMMKKLKVEGMKDPPTRLQYKLMEIEPATLQELARKLKVGKAKVLAEVCKLLELNILSVSCTKVDKLMKNQKKK